MYVKTIPRLFVGHPNHDTWGIYGVIKSRKCIMSTLTPTSDETREKLA